MHMLAFIYIVNSTMILIFETIIFLKTLGLNALAISDALVCLFLLKYLTGIIWVRFEG